jgi:ATP synthase I chain
METTPTANLPSPAPDEASALVLRRIRRISLAAYVVFAAYILPALGWRSLAGLTCGAAVTMINFLWLEEIVNAVLQPTPRLKVRRLLLRVLARFPLLGVALSVAIFVARFNAVSVLLGFSIVVVGIMGEALYSAIRGSAD